MARKNNKKYENIAHHSDDFKIVTVSNRKSSFFGQDNPSDIFHEDFEIKLFVDGSSTLVIGDEAVLAEVGDIVAINPYEFHSTVDLGEKKGVYHLLMIGMDFFDGENGNYCDLRQIFIKERNKIESHIKGDSRLADIIKHIVCEMEEKKSMYKNVVRGLVLELFCLLLRDYKSREILDLPEDKNIRSYEVIYPAIKKIRKDYAEKISVDELAALCNVSKYHFCRMFKEVTTLSALNYQTEYRLRIADNLLRNTDKSISEIAALCGFEDVCYFSRCYKKHIGLSPRQKRAILSK